MSEFDSKVSQFRFYGYGRAAANLPISSDMLEVHPSEDMPNADGEIDSTPVPVQAEGKKSSGEAIVSVANTTNSISAKWLPLSGSNRLTPPNIRRGESIVLFQFGDTDKYYWTTLANDHRLRRLETVVYGFSATRDEAATLDHSNMYYLEVSTHNKLVSFHTSTSDGEPYGYDIQINTKEGTFLITDTIGNRFELVSRQHLLKMTNTDGSFVKIEGPDGEFNCPNSIRVKTTSYTLDCDTSQTNASSITENASTIEHNVGNETINGDLSVNGNANIN